MDPAVSALWTNDLVNVGIIILVVIDLLLVTSLRLATAIKLNAAQAALLAVLPLLLGNLAEELHLVIMSVAIVVIRVLVVPPLLWRSIRHSSVRHEPRPLVGGGAALSIAGVLVAISFWLGTRLVLPEALGPAPSLLVPGAFATVLLGLFLLVSRVLALTQVIAYLTLENGISLFGLALARETPWLVELGILLDLFVGVFVMGIVIFQINRTFEDLDTTGLTQLHD